MDKATKRREEARDAYMALVAEVSYVKSELASLKQRMKVDRAERVKGVNEVKGEVKALHLCLLKFFFPEVAALRANQRWLMALMVGIALAILGPMGLRLLDQLYTTTVLALGG